ncbi:MAG TPA: efflux RND transporter periplasmic adaptor subunit [Verrucomicrobiae bacterium]|nr:efflux RND transporter periplasmic adaptor subunit [Verrucomicrobiae bacterium]
MTVKELHAMLAIGLLAAAGCDHRPTPADAASLPPATVSMIVAKTTPSPAIEEVVGTVRSKTRAVIEARVGGRIEELAVSAGQLVRKGDLIAQLDVREVQARLDQARATLEQANRDLERFTALIKQNVLTKAEYDAAEARQRVAKAAVDEAETMLGYARVVAPFDGVITRKIADVGDLAAVGRGIVELEDPVALRVEANVPEGLINFIKLGARLPVSAAEAHRPISGTISEVAPAADPASRTFLVKLDLPAGSDLRLGQFVRVAVPLGERNALRLPTNAVIVRGQMEMVVVDHDHMAQLRLIKTGRRTGGDVEIVSGLDDGERVVAEGAAGLQDGQPLREKP